MSVQITIIGLGQVGASIGLALAEQKSIKRVGHDKNYQTARAVGSEEPEQFAAFHRQNYIFQGDQFLANLTFLLVAAYFVYAPKVFRFDRVIRHFSPSSRIFNWVNMLENLFYYIAFFRDFGPCFCPNKATFHSKLKILYTDYADYKGKGG